MSKSIYIHLYSFLYTHFLVKSNQVSKYSGMSIYRYSHYNSSVFVLQSIDFTSKYRVDPFHTPFKNFKCYPTVNQVKLTPKNKI